ncbi:MAG: proton-conducting transporter membrane subunit, partial [Chloroflexi bacterium]|nr:proton-conducting transporter membrane subunit [Chloroflexota bacterium]
MLTAITFVPMIGAALALAVRGSSQTTRLIALATVLAELGLTISMYVIFSAQGDVYQFVQRAPWVSAFGIEFLVGVDGLSAPLVLLNGILGLAAVLVSWRVETRVREYFMWLLVLQGAVMGVFVSLDLILFFIFWELELVPMFFLISVWGTGRRDYSAMKFLLFTFLGSAFMFAAILALYFSSPAGERTFDMTALIHKDLTNLIVPSSLVFSGFLVAF